jgi:hypothetical protein
MTAEQHRHLYVYHDGRTVRDILPSAHVGEQNTSFWAPLTVGQYNDIPDSSTDPSGYP